jgi:hypothetical protein
LEELYPGSDVDAIAFSPKVANFLLRQRKNKNAAEGSAAFLPRKEFCFY